LFLVLKINFNFNLFFFALYHYKSHLFIIIYYILL